MDNSTEPALIPGQSAPLTVITSTDQSGVVIIATALALAFASISILLRLFIRIEFRHRFFGDDVAALISMAFMAIQATLVFTSVSHGFGKTREDVSDSDLVTWEKYTYISDIFYVLTLWSTKLSVALLFIRLSPDKSHILVSHVFMAVSGVLMVVSVLVISLRCKVTEPWAFAGLQCPGLSARWQAVFSFDVLSEVGLFLIAIYIVQGLQLALRKKMVVVFAFGLRIPVIAAAAIHLHYKEIAFSSTNPSLDGVLATVCADIELCYAIVATTIPCLRPFMSALSTNYGGPTNARTSPGATTGAGYNISLGSLATLSKLGQPEKEKKDTSVPTTRWDEAEYNVNVATGDQGSMLSNDSRRNIISKNTEWVVDYERRGKV